jgi:hypothetical protein
VQGIYKRWCSEHSRIVIRGKAPAVIPAKSPAVITAKAPAVIPAKAGIHVRLSNMGSRLRGNDNPRFRGDDSLRKDYGGVAFLANPGIASDPLIPAA